MKQNILILHTGGTFGMVSDEMNRHSFAPHATSTSYLQNLCHKVPEIEEIANIQVEVLFNVDSSHVNPGHWETMAKTILENWDRYDGFVIIHGTDTLAYTSSALAFFLTHLTKTVVLTGSQRPLSQRRNDARANLIDSVELACTGIPEVLVCFDGLVHRGVRVTKESNEHLHAFVSPNVPPLAEFGVHFRIRKSQVRPHIPPFSRILPNVDTRVCSKIAALTAVPGIEFSRRVCEALVQDFQGLVVIGFGSGNLSLEPKGFLQLAQVALEAQVPVVMASQCKSGMVLLDSYDSGRRFSELGVVSSRDMTLEATSLKLMILLGRGIPFAQRSEFFATPLANELTLNVVQEEEG